MELALDEFNSDLRAAEYPGLPCEVMLDGCRLEVSAVYWDYWYLAAERQAMFMRRLSNDGPSTFDPILRAHRFTNAYRASDRVSQFLLQRVIYDEEREAHDTVFRTLLFKIFNRTETWLHLLDTVGEPTLATFDCDRYIRTLDERFAQNDRLYSSAYIMPSPAMGRTRKHANHIELLESLIYDGTVERLAGAQSLGDLYRMLREVPSFGPFLAFQYSIDLNYGPAFDFSEMEFVVAGPGARRGIAKCFPSARDEDVEDLIRAVAAEAPRQLAELGIDFQDLWGRPLQLIDCQNLFCEVDKYSRVAHPEVGPSGGPTRIKQNYRRNTEPIQLGYPPKWGLPLDARTPICFPSAGSDQSSPDEVGGCQVSGICL